MSSPRKDKVITVFVLKYNGVLSPSILPPKYHQDLVCSRRVHVNDITSASSIVSAVTAVVAQSLLGYWGSFCWQFTEASICSYYQSLLDQRDKKFMADFSMSYVIERWGEVYVRLTSPLPGNCPKPSDKITKPNEMEQPKKQNRHQVVVLTLKFLEYNGITRPSVHMRVTDEIPLTSVRMCLKEPRTRMMCLPDVIRQTVRKAFPEYTGGLVAVIPADDVCHRFQELLDQEQVTSLIMSCERKFQAAAFFPLYSSGGCKTVYVRLTSPLTLSIKGKASDEDNAKLMKSRSGKAFSLVVSESPSLKRQAISEYQRRPRREKYVHSVKC